MRRAFLAGLSGGVVAGLYFALGRSYPVPLALIMALAVGALVFSVVRTADRLRATSRRDD